MKKNPNSQQSSKSFIYNGGHLTPMGKRGQVTIFIIIGAVLLIAAISYFAINELFLKDRFQSALEKSKNVPQQIQPIQNYLDTCTQDIATKGINIIGLQGGYIDTPESNLPRTQFNPLGASLEIFPNSNFKTAVWFRNEGGVQKTSVPTTNDMQKDLEVYISENYKECLDGLDQFSEQGFSFIISGEPRPKVTIGEDSVDITVALPIQVIKEGISFNLEEHLAQVDARLGEMHTMATEILNKENSDFFMEKKTIDMLVAYDSEVPFSGSSTSCQGKVWSKTSVIQKFKNILMENVAAFRIKGTNYVLQDSKYDYLVFDVLNKNHKDITVSMMYTPEFPTSVDITPSEGDRLKEDSINQGSLPEAAAIISSFFCLSRHRFVYTVKYPILITLTAPDGYTFQFATQVLIERNEPRQNREEFVDLPSTDDQLCKYPQQEITFETYTIKPTGDLIPLTGADINFKCSTVSCALDIKSVESKSGNIGEGKSNHYTALVPACINGVLEAKKEGYYLGKVIEISTNEPIKDVIPITLIPLYKKNVKIYIIDKTTGEIREPYSSEQVMFQFTHNLREAPYGTAIVYPSENGNKIELIPGDFSITSYVIGNSTWPITTPKQNIQNCFDTGGGLIGLLVGGAKEQCVTVEIPETKMYTAMKGGANFNFTFIPEDLAKNSDLVLYTMASPIPSTMEEMAKITREIETNSDDPNFKYPEL